MEWGVGERPWSKVSTWQQEPSVCYFKLWIPDRTFCFQHTQGQRDLSKDQEARIIRITLAVTSFPVGWRKQRLEWFAERNAHFYQALKLSLLMSRFQSYGMVYSHIHMFQGLSMPLSPNPVKSIQEQADRTSRVDGYLHGLISRALERHRSLHLHTHCSNTPSEV